MLFYGSGVKIQTVTDLRRKTRGMQKKWLGIHLFSPGGLAPRERHKQSWSTCFCSRTPLRLDGVALHSCACAFLYICGVNLYEFQLIIWAIPRWLIVVIRLRGRQSNDCTNALPTSRV